MIDRRVVDAVRDDETQNIKQVLPLDMHKLRWACRRGMLELDLILLPFVENVYAGLPVDDQQRFDLLLEEQDQDLFQWFLGKEEPSSDDLKHIVHIVLQNTGLR